MKTSVSRLLATTVAFTGFAVVATPAAAQRVDRIVAFGDSYADDGNFFELTGVPRPAAYATGRFSNGTNFIDTLSLLLARPVDNFAIGGAFTGTGNINNVPGLGFQLEYQSFLAGGGPAAFPRVSGQFGPNDLLAISIGGNDARAYRLSGGTVAGAAAAAAPRVTEATTGLTALVGAGARNITFLAGDVGRLPEAVGQPSAAAGTAFSTAFNQGMRTTLAGFANQGVIVNYLDLNLIGDRVQANPAAFGLQSAGAATAADVAAGRADNFLFYADNVHLTSAGFAIVGRYAARQLEAPLQLEAQAQTALFLAEGFGDAIEGRLDLASAEEGDGPPLRLFVGGEFAQMKGEESQTSFAYRTERSAAHVGVEYDAGQLIAGAMIGAARGDTDMSSTTGGIDSESLHAGVYASWSNGNFFVEGFGAVGRVDLGIRRAGVIDEVEGDGEGDTLAAGAQLGYLFDVGQVKLGPVVGINYVRTNIDGYTERGDAVLTLNVEDQQDDQLVGSLGVELNADMDVGGARVAPFLIARAEREFDNDPRTIRYALTAAPTIVNSWQVGGGEEETYGRLAGGANFAVTRGITLQVTGGTTLGREGGDNSSATLAVRVGF